MTLFFSKNRLDKAPNGEQEDDDEYVEVQDDREVEQQQAALGEDN